MQVHIVLCELILRVLKNKPIGIYLFFNLTYQRSRSTARWTFIYNRLLKAGDGIDF